MAVNTSIVQLALILTWTSKSVLLIARPKCTLAASHDAPWRATVSMPMGETDGWTPDHYIMLSARRGLRNNTITYKMMIGW